MPIIRPQGLNGLKGFSDLSNSEKETFLSANAEKLNIYRNPKQRKNAAEVLYMNQKFINTFGEEAFNKMNDGTQESFDLRNNYLKEEIVNNEFSKIYSPINDKGIRDNTKGLGKDWEKYNQLSTDGKLKLMESGYLTNEEFENQWKKEITNFDSKSTTKGNWFTNIFGNPQLIGGGTQPQIDKTVTKDNMFSESVRKMKADKNQRILDTIYNDDVDAAANKYSSEVTKVYSSPELTNLTDTQVKQAFIKAITPGNRNLGISEYASHYGNGSADQISSEMKDFSINDMRQILAKKIAYEQNMSPDMAATALNNEAKRYIKAHQGDIKRFGLFLKDVGISALSYSADKVNGIYNLGLMAADSMGEKPTVLVDDRGIILDPNKTTITKDGLGKMVYLGDDNKPHYIHQEQIDRTTLHNMGKNFDGSEDESILNQQYWTRAEQFGTLDKEEQKQYEKLGSSPYKVSYNPNEDSDLMYEAFKMASFGIADMGAQLLPFGIGVLGRSLSMASKAGKAIQGLGKVMDVSGRMFTAQSKTGQVLQGTAGALGIANAYQRGAFQETLAKNLADVDETVLTKSRNDIFNQYNSDKNYKAKIDSLVNAEAANMKTTYIAQAKREGMQIADEKALDKMLHARAQQSVLDKIVQEEVSKNKSSKEYADLQQRAITEAGDAASNTFLPEAIKYGFVNTLGFRKYLYTNPAGVAKKVSSTLKGITEISTKEGAKRLVVQSKFLTRGDKLKQFSKTLGSQIWEGAWTNGTDDMQVDAAERMSNDSFSRYLQQYQNGEAIADTYGFVDGLYSYIKGMQNSLGQETTWNAAAVGGLGSIVTVTPNFVNIAHYMTKEGRQAFKEQYGKTYERDENGLLKYTKDDKGNDVPVTRELSFRDNWRDRFNFFIQNGVLNTYYGNKQSERELQSHADFVNTILDDWNDFKDIESLVSSNIISNNYGTLLEKDEDGSLIYNDKTKSFIKAINAVNALQMLGNNKKDAATLSSVVEQHKALIDKASQLDNPEQTIFSGEEINNLLSQYYASNPGIEQSEDNSQEALSIIAKNAQKLQEATEAFNKAEEQIQKIEKNRGERIDPSVRHLMKMQQSLNSHWQERLDKMKEEIEDTSSDNAIPNSQTVIASVGGKKNAESLIKIYGKQQVEISKELEHQKKKTEELHIKTLDAIDALNTAVESDDSDAKLTAQKEYKKAIAEENNSKQAEKYLEAMIAMTEEKRTKLTSTSENVTEDILLTADEIFSLDAVSRARMLRKENRNLYDKTQQREIEKLEQQLIMKDADALQKIQDIALLTQRINSNKDAYSRIAENPEAAAVMLENQRDIAINAAERLIDVRNANIVADSINGIITILNAHTEVTKNSSEIFVFDSLKKLSSKLLDIIDEDNLLPNYQKQVDDAKEFRTVFDDIVAIIGESDKEISWKNDTIKDIDEIVKVSYDREDFLANLEKAIDANTDNPEKVASYEYILNGLENQGYMRDATVIEDRKQRKQREDAERKQREAEQLRIEEEAKAAAEKSITEDATKNNVKALELEDVSIEEDATTMPETSTVEDKKGRYSVDENFTVTKEYATKNLGTTYTEAATEEDVNKYEQPKIKATADYLNGELTAEEYANVFGTKFYGEKSSQDLQEWANKTANTYKKCLIDNNSSKEKTDNSEKNSTFAEPKDTIDMNNNIQDTEITDEEGNIIIESVSIEKQLEDIKNEEKKISISDATTDADMLNTLGERSDEIAETTLSGNAMSEWEIPPLIADGSLVHKKGAKEGDSMNQYYDWMNSAGIKLQNIIDQELGEIIKQNPHAKVKFMSVKVPKLGADATNDKAMQNHLMLVLDYDNSINKNITTIHNKDNGGVIESLGKKYLVIGTVGYSKNNAEKLALYDRLWNPYTADGFNLKKQRKQFFDAHPEERFYVNEELSTEVVETYPTPGYIVRQTETDEVAEYRKISDLLNPENGRNPFGFDMQSLAWGIQELSKFLTIGVSPNDVMKPRQVIENLGSAFVLIPAGNGKMVPSYLRVLKYNEMLDGSLKDRANMLFDQVVSPNYNKRLEAVKELQKIFLFNKNGDMILLSPKKEIVTLTHEGKNFRTFNLNSDFDRNKFMEAIQEMNPRVNITASVFTNEKSLLEYDEAGALMTDAALLSTAGSSYSIYGLDKNGKMLKAETIDNDAPIIEDNSVLRRSRNQVIYNGRYYTEDKGTFYNNGIPVTDAAIIKQLQYNQLVVQNNIPIVKTNKTWNYFIIDEGEHPTVIKINRNTKEVVEATEEQARALIKEIAEERAKKERNTNSEKAIKEAAKETNIKENNDLEEVSLDTAEDALEIDSETGELIFKEEESKEIEVKENTSNKSLRPSNKKETAPTVVSDSKESIQSFDQMFTGFSFTDKMGIMQLIKTKWSDAPNDMNAFADFLKAKNIEVNNIGTSKEAIEAWKKTIEDCR